LRRGTETVAGRARSEREELHQHLADLARDLQNLQNSIQAARTIREDMAPPSHVWPEAPGFDPAEEQTQPWVAEETVAEALAEMAGDVPAEAADRLPEDPVAVEQEDLSGLVLQAYPTFPL
jgi:hypothetical protein